MSHRHQRTVPLTAVIPVCGRTKQCQRSLKPQSKGTHVPLDPQPPQHDILVLKRQYCSLKRDNTYKRRVSWFELLPEGIKQKQ